MSAKFHLTPLPHKKTLIIAVVSDTGDHIATSLWQGEELLQLWTGHRLAALWGNTQKEVTSDNPL